MGPSYLSEQMILSKKSASVVVILTFIGISVAGCFLLSNQFQGSFGIYLLENNKLVISEEDIVWYNRTSHEIKLTELGVKKIEGLQVSVYGSPFVIKINGEKIYNGSFVTPISPISSPPSEVVIVTLVQNNVINIQMGYPPSQFEAEDPRNNPKIFDYFQNIKKLVQ
jgi:hypothetical protein